MIQKVNAPRIGSTAVAPVRASATDGHYNPEGLPNWGSWRNGKHWKIDIIQQPIRARMCGFGDKDRRPIAPAVVTKLIVYDEDHNILEDTDIDYSFLVVTADLWSSDGKTERNLVIHPGSSDRNTSTQNVNKKQRMTGPNASDGSPPFSSTPPPPGTAPPPAPGTFGPLTIPTLPVLPSLSLQSPYEQQQTPTWPPPPFSSYEDNASLQRPRTLSISLDRSPSDDEWAQDTDVGSYRTWSADPSYAPLAPLAPAPGPLQPHFAGFTQPSSVAYNPPRPPILPQIPARIELHEAPSPSSQSTATPSAKPSADASAPASASMPEAEIGVHRAPYDDSMYASASLAQGFPLAPGASQGVSGKGKARKAAPGDAYTRTLVGPVASSASRLLDEHRKPGIFFLFQDLSIRTEGSFRLRLRLMNLGPPIPPMEDEIPSINTGFSAVLSEVFSEPFDVYTAKRFPGVPDTTALSIAFGNQGQKLPLRSRHGSRKGRRRRGEESSDDDDD